MLFWLYGNILKFPGFGTKRQSVLTPLTMVGIRDTSTCVSKKEGLIIWGDNFGSDHPLVVCGWVTFPCLFVFFQAVGQRQGQE